MDRRDLNGLRRRLRFRAWCAAAALLAPAFAASASAQSLDTLRVRSFSLSVDPSTVRVGESFTLRLSLRIAQQRAQIDGVVLPDLAGFDNLGDARSCTANKTGTTCTETLTLVPENPGTATIGPAKLDAIDGRTGKPSRFATNVVRLAVLPGVAPSAALPPTAVPQNVPEESGEFDPLAEILRGMLFLLFAAIVIWVALYAMTRNRRPRVAPPPADVASRVQAPSGDPDAMLRYAVAALRAAPTRQNAIVVRALLRDGMHAGEKETLADLVRRNASADRPDRLAALRAIDPAAFCEDDRVGATVDTALPSLAF